MAIVISSRDLSTLSFVSFAFKAEISVSAGIARENKEKKKFFRLKIPTNYWLVLNYASFFFRWGGLFWPTPAAYLKLWTKSLGELVRKVDSRE